MDEDIFQYLMIGMYVVLLILIALVGFSNDVKDDNVIGFIYDQCIMESNINVSYSTGAITIFKEDELCIIKRVEK